MAKKKFDYQFEDIRRESTPVTAAGFGEAIDDLDNPDEAFVDVNLDEDDAEKAVSVAKDDVETKVSTETEDRTKTSKDQRRETLATRRKADQLEQDLEEGRNEFATEVNSLKKEIAGLKAGSAVNQIEQEFGAQEGNLTTEMESAMEAGDVEAQARINTQLIALSSEKQAKKAAAEASVTIIEDLDTPSEDQPASKRAVQFIRDNESWWSDPDHEDAEEYARKLDEKLVGMGFNPEADVYWERFNHNFDRKFPDLRVKDDDIDIDLDSPRKKSPVSRPATAGAPKRAKEGSTVRLTAQHKANMVRFHLDPADPEHCAEYAKQVAATARNDERRAS